MKNKNNKLDAFLDEYGFDDNVISDLFEYEDLSGLYIADLSKLNRSSGEATVYIPSLDYTVVAPLFYNRGINIGETVLIYLDNDSSGKIIGLHSKSKLYEGQIIEDKDKLAFGNSEIIIGSNKISMVVGKTEYEFKSNSVSVHDTSLLSNFQVNLPSMSTLNVQDLDVVGSSIDIKLGSMNSLSRRIPFTSTRPSGFSVSALFGNVDITSIVGSVNISSLVSTNVSAGAMLNLIGGATAGIMSPFISNLTVGFGVPLIPSPIPVVALPDLLNNNLNPFRLPLPNALNHIVNKIRTVLP